MTATLTNRVAVVTGAGSGLGEATARALARAGCRVAGLDVNRAAVERAATALGGNGQALPIVCDVGDEVAVADAVRAVDERWGRLDILVNCAAVDHTIAVRDMTVEQWDQVLAVNLRGPFLLSKAVWPLLERQGGGHIFNIASTAATRAWGNAAAYHATKWGLVGFGRGLGVEGRPHGIRVTTVIPGGMQTHFFDRFVEQGIPMPDQANLQDPAVVADVIVYAAGLPAASNMQEVIVTPLTETSWP
jgi:NAD(P)-dependent dehydrogenase (short-subunit alcohol dehydrogenase family)